MKDPSEIQNIHITGDARRAFAARRQDLGNVGCYGHAEMLRNDANGNAIAERMSHAFLDDKAHSSLSSISKTFTYVLRHGLIAENQHGYNDWALQTYDPDTRLANARQILSRRRASHAMQ